MDRFDIVRMWKERNTSSSSEEALQDAGSLLVLTDAELNTVTGGYRRRHHHHHHHHYYNHDWRFDRYYDDDDCD